MKREIKPENIGKTIKEELDLPKSLIGFPTLKSISPISRTIDNTEGKKPIIGIFKLRSSKPMARYTFQENQAIEQQHSIAPNDKDSITASHGIHFYDNTTQIFIAIEEYNTNPNTTFLSQTNHTFHIKTSDIKQVKSNYAYMIEVWKDHNFYIGDLALLVHNPTIEMIERLLREAEEKDRRAEEARRAEEEREELQRLRMTSNADLGRIEELIDKYETPK